MSKIVKIMSDKGVLYQSHSTDMKRADRSMRVLRAILIFILDIVILYGMFFIQIILGAPYIIVPVIIFVVLTVLVLPVPLLIVPDRYRILSTGVDSDGKKLFPLKTNYRINVNDKRRYVSVLHPRRGEFMRLYSSEPKELQLALQKIIQHR